MANVIRIKRKSTTGAPTAGQLEQGELAINLLDEKLYSKNSSDAIFEIGNGGDFLPLAGGTMDAASVTVFPGGVSVPTAPTIGFGDGDTGIYEYPSNNLRYTFSGVEKYQMSATHFSGVTSASFYLANEATSRTNPTLGPRRDLTTGLGSAAASEMSLIAGSVEIMRIVEGANDYAMFEKGTYFAERASAHANITGYGQLWAGTDNSLNFTDEAGANTVLTAGGTIGGSITDNQIAVGATTANSIEGSALLTWDASTLLVDGSITVYGDATSEAVMSHSGGTAPNRVFTFDFSTTDYVDFTNMGAPDAYRFRDGAQLEIYDSTDLSWLYINHDGTDVNWVGVNTDDFILQGLTWFKFLGGAGFALYDGTNADEMNMRHTGTHFEQGFVGTTDWNIGVAGQYLDRAIVINNNPLDHWHGGVQGSDQIRHIMYPKGGSFKVDTSGQTGAFLITLPNTAGINNMAHYVIRGFDYTTASSAWTLNIGGYDYPTTDTWISANAVATGNPPFGVVKFMTDDTTAQMYIQLGETTDTQEYPQIWIESVTATFQGQDNENLIDGWTIALSTSEVGRTAAATRQLKNDWSDGTNFNSEFNGNSDWNITGLTRIDAGTVDADFDAITATTVTGANVTSGSDPGHTHTAYQAAGNYLLDTTDTFTGTLTVTGTVAATTVTGANVTTGANPGHTHTGSSISSLDAGDITTGTLAVLRGGTGVTTKTGTGSVVLSASPTFTGTVSAPLLNVNTLGNINGNYLIINAGESVSYATGQTGEQLYVNAEGGLQVNSSPDNWASLWAGRDTATICAAGGASTFPGNVTVTGTVAGTTITGANVTSGSNPGHTHTGTSISALDTGDITTGTMATARLGSGTASSSTYLRGDSTWAAISGILANAQDITGGIRVDGTGTASHMDLYTSSVGSLISRFGWNTGGPYWRSYSHGAAMQILAEDAGGTARTILLADPDSTTELRADTNLELSVTAGADTALLATTNADVALYYNNNLEFQTQSSLGTGQTSGAKVRHHNQSLYDVGFNVLPDNSNDASFNLTAVNCGHCSLKTSSTARTVTLFAGTSTDFPIDGVFTYLNAFTSGNVTINASTNSATLYWLDGSTRQGGASTNRTLGPGGVMTIRRHSTTTYYMWGSGIS